MQPPKAKSAGTSAARPNRRQEASEQRRLAILAAALDVFAAQGFAASRLEDVAERAGVAKGTIYLFFRDKEDLFEQLLINAIAPVLTRIEALAEQQLLPLDDMLAALHDFFRKEVLATKRREVVRLVLTEGRRFPRIAEVYHREVISKGLALVAKMAGRANERGEPAADELVNFPHLVFAPLVVSLLWDGLFSKSETLDVEGLLAAHRRLLTGTAGAAPKGKS